MKDHIKFLIADMLSMASDEFGNHGCNDYKLPKSWTQEQKEEFLKPMWLEQTGEDLKQDPEYLEHLTKCCNDSMIMEHLAYLMRESTKEDFSDMEIINDKVRG